MIEPAPAGSSDGTPLHTGRLAVFAVPALALATAVCLGYPPEVWPASGVIAAVLLALGLVASGNRLPLSVVLAAAALVLVNAAVSLSPGRTIETIPRLVLPAAAFVLAAAVDRRTRRPVLAAMAAVGAALGFVAVLQRAGLLARDALLARELGLPAEVISRLEQERAFATHALPAALAGALTVALFAAGAAALASRRRVHALLFGVCGALCAIGLLMTASIGGLFGLIAGGAVVLFPLSRRWPRRWTLLLVALTAAMAVTVVALRPESVFALDRPNHSLTLRLGNWSAAAKLALVRPSAGIGLGAFGAVFPSVRQAGDSETVYAHNAWLQLVAEGGLPAAALLAACALVLARRMRRTDDDADRCLLAGVTAFAAHNLLDFTAYLPGVSVAAMALAGLLFASSRDRRNEREADRTAAPRPRRAATALVALAALAAAVPFAGEAVARPALPWTSPDTVRDASSAAPAVWRASRFIPWSPRLLVRAGRLLSDSPEWRSAAATLALRARWVDPESPAPWHLLGRVRLQAGRATDGWRALSTASSRHPADLELRALTKRLEDELTERGWLSERNAAAANPARTTTLRAEGWDRLLLLVHLAVLVLIAVRWLRPRGAPAEAVALSALVLIVIWADGGALPGARLGRHLLIAGAALAWLVPLSSRDRGAEARPSGVALAPILLFTPAAVWAAVSAALAPDGAAARNGLMSFLAPLVAIAISWDLSRRYENWRKTLLVLVSVSAATAAAVLIVQHGALAWGADPSSWPSPFTVFGAAAQRPAGDFYHPGHLGTFLVACGLMLCGSGLPGARDRARPLCVVLGAALVLPGLWPGARASLVALLVGALVLVWAVPHRRARRLMLLLAALSAIVAVVLIFLRFSSADPYAFDRVKIWPASLAAAATRPLTGFGPGGFAELAASFAFPDDHSVARYGRQFRGPHSDVVSAVVHLGVPGALLLFGALLAIGRRCARAARESPLDAGMLAALAALSAHGVVDDLFGERPAAAIVAALIAGAIAGRRATEDLEGAASGGRMWRPSLAARGAIAVAAVSLLVGAELRPYVAFRTWAGGEPGLAAAIDPGRASLHLSAARAASGSTAERFLSADDATWRALRASPSWWRPRVARAELLTKACRGPLDERGVCEAAVASWGGALALRPHDVQSRRARARLQMRLRRAGPAIADLRLAIRDEPNYLGAREDLVRALEQTGRPRAAARERRDLRAIIENLEGFRPSSPYEQMLLTRATPRGASAAGAAP